MDSVGHSRLLKFLVGENKLNKMEAPVYTIEFEYINPTNIESEVPGKQEIREGDANDIATQDFTLDLNNKVDNPNDYVLSPVITVTKQESEFTKGDLKLQKVSVTENISELNDPIPYKNSNPNIHDEVIRGPQPIRIADNNGKEPMKYEVFKPDDLNKENRPVRQIEANNERGTNKEANGRNPNKDDDPKARTRIPTLKFKQAVQAVRERRNSSDKNDEVPPPRLLQKRSSIPRLKDSRIPPPLDRRSSKPDIKVETPQPEDEFEKIYDEIITEPKETVIEAIENIKVEDPEKLENKFEEIIHDYEENKVHPITDDIPVVEKPKSKIPLSKRKSEHEIKLPKPVERTSIKKDEPKPDKLVIETRIPIHKDIPHKFGRSKSNISRNDDTESEGTSNKVVISKQISIETPMPIDLKSKNTNEDPVKVVEREVIEIKMRENIIKEVDKPKSIGLRPIHDKQEKPNVVGETKPEHLTIPQENVVIVENMIDTIFHEALAESLPMEHSYHNDMDKTNEIVQEKEKPFNSKNDDQDNMDVQYTPGKVSKLLQRIRSQEFGTNDPEPKKETPIVIPKKKSVLSKIALFERQDPEEAPVSRLPRSNKLPNKKPKDIKTETMQEEVIYRKPVIVNELLKNTDTDTAVHDIKKEYSLPEQADHTTNKDYKVEIEENAVKYIEVQVINPVEEIKYNDVKNASPITNGIDKPVVQFIPSTPVDSSPVRLTNKFEPPSNTIENIPKPGEFLQPPIENIDEKVPREIVIETLVHKSTEYEIKAESSSDDKPLLVDKDNLFEYETNVNIKEEIPIESITLQETKIETLEFAPKIHKNKIGNPDEVFRREPKAEKWTKSNENGEFKRNRPKSVAEMDLGDAVKGKVHQMIVRMNSFEKQEKSKKEIDPRERPKKKSVSNMIAMFEQKSLALEAPTTLKPVLITKHPASTPTPPKTLSDEELQRRISALKNGRITYGRVENMTYMLLNNGAEMPVIAVGTAMDPWLVRHVVEAAIDMGYRAIDTAYIYGTEKAVGEAIKAKIDDGTVSRGELFIINKLWSTFHRPDLVKKACERSLATMGLSYFDLYLIHNPVSFLEGGDPVPKVANVVQYSAFDYLDAWYSMEELVFKGLAKSIGVSNFNSVQVQTVVERGSVKPVINQVECHPYLTQDNLDAFCSARDVKLSCYGVLGSKGTAPEYRGDSPAVIDDPIVKVMAAGLNITAAQLLISFQVNSGRCVVVGASSINHLWENLESLSLNTTTENMRALKALNKNRRMFTMKGLGETHRNYPFNIPF